MNLTLPWKKKFLENDFEQIFCKDKTIENGVNEHNIEFQIETYGEISQDGG